MYLATAAEMQQMDRETIESFGIPGRVLMENAGRGATRFFLKTFKDADRARIAVVAGRGNNGGDGFVMARCLAAKGIRVTVYLLAKSGKLSGDAAANFKLLAPLGIPVVEIPDHNTFSAQKNGLRHQQIWIDAILGTGLKSDVKDYFKEVIAFINATRKPVFSVDIPSGLNADSGHPCGACIEAQATATFGSAKIGLLVYPGVSYAGKLKVIEIGIPQHIAEKVNPQQFLITPAYVSEILPPRPPEAHKGNTGHLLVVAGSPGKTGAAAMTATAAMRSGAGLVTLAVPRSLNPVLETQVIEVMTVPLPETAGGILDEAALEEIIPLLNGKACLALGPGIGFAPRTRRFVYKLLHAVQVPIVIDADGLNCVAADPQILKTLEVPVVLTPHPGEMARLIATTPQAVQQDRIGCARDFAVRFGVHLVLKGARTLVAHPDGSLYVNPSGNPGMASGGMGDVLTGVIAGLITQGCPPDAAARAGVYLHGAAGDALAEQSGPYGFMAGDLLPAIPGQIKKVMAGPAADHNAPL